MNVAGVDIPSADLLAIMLVAFTTLIRGAVNLPLTGWICGAVIYVSFVIGLATFWSREGRLEGLRKGGNVDETNNSVR